jgi:hypothetical protein
MIVDVRGVYQEYNGLSEIVIESESDVIPGDSFQLNAATVDACDVGTGGSQQEAYEGVLVWISDASVTDTSPELYGDFEVDGCLRVGSLFYDAAPAEGAVYQALIGVMNYSFDNAKLEPRTPGDAVLD